MRVDPRRPRPHYLLELGITLLFSAEYIVRPLCVPLRYAACFFGITDLLPVLPAFFFAAHARQDGDAELPPRDAGGARHL